MGTDAGKFAVQRVAGGSDQFAHRFDIRVGWVAWDAGLIEHAVAMRVEPQVVIERGENFLELHRAA